MEDKIQYGPDYILALDADTRNVGAAWFDLAGNYISDYLFRPGGKNVYESINLIGDWLQEQITRYHPVLVIYEEPISGRNRATDAKLHQLLGTIRRVCHAAKVPLMTIHPSAVKATGCHKNALAVAESIRGKPFEIRPDRGHQADEDRVGHIADAIGIGLAGLMLREKNAFQFGARI